jgi:hypothetical protein
MTATDLLIAVGALLVAVLGGWPLTTGVLHLAARSADAGAAPGATPTVASDEAAPPAVSDEAGPPAAHDDAAATGAGSTTLPDAGGDGPTGPRAMAALRGGTWIGILERAAIVGGVLAGYPAAVAFVIAVKGLGRYPEIRGHPGTSERFVIGTLASMLWAAAVGGLGRALVLGWPV